MVGTGSNEPATEDDYRFHAERLQLWRLCELASCRRGRACRGVALPCCRRFAEWAQAVKDTAERERAAVDPEVQALRAELGVRLRRLAGTLRDEP